MEWIKVEHALPGKPEVLGLASHLDIDADTALGICVRCFMWFDQQTADGCAPITPDCFDRFFGRAGLTDGLISVGWLTYDQGTLTMRDFDRHCSETAKTRADAQRRKARQRLRESTTAPDCDNGHAPPVTKTRPEPEQKRTRKEPDPTPSAGALKSGGKKGPSVFENLTTTDLRHVSNLKAWLAFQARSDSPLFSLDELKASEQTLLRVVSAACRAIEVGDRPVRLFGAIVGKRDWSKITNTQEDQARAMIAKHNTQRRKAEAHNDARIPNG